MAKDVSDVAKYILHKKGTMTSMKLQKLCYYAQAWFATWEEKSLFPNHIEAWINGPVVPELYQKHKGKFLIQENDIEGDYNNLTDLEKNDIDNVLDFYGDKDPQWLSYLTHNEDPWLKAREGLSPRERGNREIALEFMVEYYSSIV